MNRLPESWRVPDDIFHPIGMRPEWNLHFLVAIEALKVLSCDGEGAVFSDFVMVRSADGLAV